MNKPINTDYDANMFFTSITQSLSQLKEYYQTNKPRNLEDVYKIFISECLYLLQYVLNNIKKIKDDNSNPISVFKTRIIYNYMANISYKKNNETTPTDTSINKEQYNIYFKQIVNIIPLYYLYNIIINKFINQSIGYLINEDKISEKPFLKVIEIIIMESFTHTRNDTKNNLIIFLGTFSKVIMNIITEEDFYKIYIQTPFDSSKKKTISLKDKSKKIARDLINKEKSKKIFDFIEELSLSDSEVDELTKLFEKFTLCILCEHLNINNTYITKKEQLTKNIYTQKDTCKNDLIRFLIKYVKILKPIQTIKKYLDEFEKQIKSDISINITNNKITLDKCYEEFLTLTSSASASAASPSAAPAAPPPRPALSLSPAAPAPRPVLSLSSVAPAAKTAAGAPVTPPPRPVLSLSSAASALSLSSASSAAKTAAAPPKLVLSPVAPAARPVLSLSSAASASPTASSASAAGAPPKLVLSPVAPPPRPASSASSQLKYGTLANVGNSCY